MTQKIYRPSAAGGELQLKVGSKWVPIYGLSNISISGGDREVSTFETLDGGVESSVGAAGVKDIALTLNPSFFNAQYNKIITNAYYGNDQITVRYRTLAQASDIAVGDTGDGRMVLQLRNLKQGMVTESRIMTWEKTTAGSACFINSNRMLLKKLLNLGISSLLVLIQQFLLETERKKSQLKVNSLIVRYDGTVLIKFLSGKVVKLAALSAIDGWNLIRYGIAFEYACRVTSGGNPDMSPGSPIGDTLNLQQVASGFKKYPITKAAS